MKVDPRVLEVESTLEGERVGMSIDENALAHIMSVLTDLYSDPELAVIREYSTNAYDAHVEAGIKRPIEVTLPSALAPFFRVRDFGYGLDAEDIRDIYSRYGASTKRESDDVVGMLGLGCKSALSYTDQFTLRGIKDGVCTQVSVSRDEDGSGSMTILDETETDEESGVEIIVPTKKWNAFDTKAHDFFRFWNEGTVLVNGEAPDYVDGMWIADDLLLSRDVDRSVVVMGNVAYPMTSDRPMGGRYNIVAFVEIGEINFTPSRESLQMTKMTKDTLAKINERVRVERDIALMKMIEEAPNRAEALRIAMEAQRIGLGGVPHYKGEAIPLTITKDGAEKFLLVTGNRWKRRRAWSADRQLAAGTWQKSLWITGYESDSFSAYRRQKLDQWIEEKSVTRPEYFILVNELPIPEWIESDRVFPWAEINEQKIKRELQSRGDGRPSGSYEGYVDGLFCSTILAADIDTTKPVVYTEKRNGSTGYKLIDYHYKDGSTVLLLNANRINKFKRDFPMALDLRTHCRELGEAWKKNLSSSQTVSVQLHRSSSVHELKCFDPECVEDPELKQHIELSKVSDKILLEAANQYLPWTDLPDYHYSNPLNKYALLTSASRYDIMSKAFQNEVYIYLNAAYAAKQEDK